MIYKVAISIRKKKKEEERIELFCLGTFDCLFRELLPQRNQQNTKFIAVSVQRFNLYLLVPWTNRKFKSFNFSF